jgi:hypothetical protein
MALATTTLSSAVAQTDVNIVVASATSVAAGRIVIVDQEIMQVASNYTSGTTVPVLRGREGSAQVAHKVTANVTHGLASDFALAGAQSEATYLTQRPVLIQSITAATSTLTLPPAGCDLRVILNGTAAITLTVPVPTKDMDGCKLTIISNGAAAHVPTFTGGVGGAGSNYDAFTFNSTGTLALEAYACNGLWCMVAATPIAGTVTNITATVG